MSSHGTTTRPGQAGALAGGDSESHQFGLSYRVLSVRSGSVESEGKQGPHLSHVSWVGSGCHTDASSRAGHGPQWEGREVPGTGWARGDEKRLTAGPCVAGLAVERERVPRCCGRKATVGGK